MTANQKLTHLRGDGTAFMVDVTDKTPTKRTATAVAVVETQPEIIAALRDQQIPKGDVLAVARIAGIQAAKKTPELLPLAHVIGVHGCEVDFTVLDKQIEITATVRTADRTGVEMEALTAVTVAALTIVDMLKGVDKLVKICSAQVIAKQGGRSGNWHRPGFAAES